MKTQLAQNKDKQVVTIINKPQPKIKYGINIREKVGDFCFDTVKYILTGSIISTIFIEFNSAISVIICGFIIIIAIFLVGLWFYKK